MSEVKNIFLVDDDDIFVFLTKKMIVATGERTNIQEFSDGEQALAFLKANLDQHDALPDVIFLDLSMPIMDGWEFLGEYAVIEPSLKKKASLYIVSSSISPHDIEKAKQFDMVTDFIIKPLAKEKFIAIMDRL